jgi:hypothetical protein
MPKHDQSEYVHSIVKGSAIACAMGGCSLGMFISVVTAGSPGVTTRTGAI